MSEKQASQATRSERTTGNDPVSGTDPGGTRPAPGKSEVAGAERKTEQRTDTGDRNEMTVSSPLRKS